MLRSSSNMAEVSIDDLRRKAPSIFTESGSAKTSQKYQHISTIKVVQGLISEGFIPVKVFQNNTRTNEKSFYAKHMLRFRHINSVPRIGGLHPELVLVNSHDGLCSYRLVAGLYRLICSNGLVAGNAYNEIRIRHQGDVMHNVIEGTYTIMQEANKLLENADRMSQICLSEPEKMVFAEAVHQLRFEDDESSLKEAIKPCQFLKFRRFEDNKHDLFTVFNVAQENAIKGGLRGVVMNAYRQPKRVTSRSIRNIEKSNTLNRALWTLAEKMMHLKETK